MSDLIATQMLNFIINLRPDDNPYQAMAHYMQRLIQPAYLPSGWTYIEHFIGLGFFIMSCQAFWVLLLRSKTKKLYQIGYNHLGLIQLDRANHCGLCYLLYGIIAMMDIIFDDLLSAGLLQPAWPSFVRGIKCTFTITCACVILWLSLCYYLLSLATAMPKYLIRSLNGFLLVMIFLSPIPLLYSWLENTLQYQRLQENVNPVIADLRHLASSYSPANYSSEKLMKELSPLMKRPQDYNLVVYYSHCGFLSYLVISVFVVLIYIPLIFLSFVRTRRIRAMDEALRRQHQLVMLNTLLECTIMVLFIVLTAFLLSLFTSGDSVHDPRFWLAVRIGMNGVICILGNLAIFMVLLAARKSGLLNQELSKAITDLTAISSTTLTKEV